MKIVNLGTSHGDPTPNHHCSSTLIETAGKYYLVDCGEPANASLVRRGLQASQLTAIFITHMHLDHTGSLPMLRAQAHKYRSNFPDLHLKILLPDAKAIKPLQAWNQANYCNVLDDDLTAYDECHGYADGTLAMSAVKTGHLQMTHITDSFAYALTIRSEGKKVFFTGDLTSTYQDFPLQEANGADLVYSEITHYPLECAIPILEKLQTKRLIFYHIGNLWQSEEQQKLALERCRCLPYEVSFAYDGRVVEL